MSGTEYAVILFVGTSHAIQADSVLKQSGIACKMIPVPRHISSDCGVCVRIGRQDRVAAAEVLRAAGTAWESMEDC